ncbi:glycosyltransferase family 2 protein [Cellulomonas sp. P5_C5]
MTGTVDVTVVTVTYDAADLVRACLDGLRAQELGDVTMDVVVVDNGSADGTADLVASEYPEVRLIASPVNAGFTGGNNLALAGLRSRYAVLLNNDAVPAPTFVATLVQAMDRAAPEVAAMAATVLLAARFRPAGPDDALDGTHVVHGPDGSWVEDADGPVRLVNSTGNEVRTDGFGVDRGWLADASGHHPARDVFGFSGAAAILRTSALRAVGLFDERLFMYYEDTDLSWRLRLAGYRVEHCAPAVVSHIHAASSSEGSDFFRFHDLRNRLAVVTKNASAGLALRCVLRFGLTTASVGLRRRQPWPQVRTRLRASRSYLGLLPHLLAERRRIGRSSTVARGTVDALLVPPTAGTGSYRT